MTKRLILMAVLAAALACEQRSPTEPDTREVPVTTIEAGQHAIHYNTAVRLADGSVAFVCGYHGGTHRMIDGTAVKVNHMLSSTPCNSFGVGTPYQPR